MGDLPVKTPNVKHNWIRLVVRKLRLMPIEVRMPPTKTTQRHENLWQRPLVTGANPQNIASNYNTNTCK